MGDARFDRPYERLRAATNRTDELHGMSDEEVVQALAAASKGRDPLLANVLATEAMNRMRRSQTAMAHLGEGILATDLAGRVTSVNLAAERLLGYSREELIGRDIHETIHDTHEHDRSRPRETCPVLGVLVTGEAIERDDDVFTRKDGALVHVAYTAAPILLDREVHGLVTAFRDITDRRRAQAQILFQKSLLEAQAESSPDGQIVVDQDRNVLSYNASFLSIWNLTEEDLETGDDRKAVATAARSTADPDAFVARVEAIYASGADSTRDEVELSDGRILDRFGATVRSPDGATFGWLWTFRDVTAERRSLERLRLSEERYRTLYHAVPFLTFTVGPDLGVRNTNLAAAEQLGYSRDEIEGASVLDLYAPDDRPMVERALRDLLSRGGVRSLEVRKVRRDGSLLPVRETTTRTRSPAGDYVLLTLCEDISPRKQHEAALARSQERLRALFSGSPDGIVTVDTDGTVLDANDSSIPFTGRHPDEVKGRPFLDYVDPHDRERVWTLFGEVVGGKAVRTEFGILHKGGPTTPARVTGIPIVVDGEVVGVHGVLENLTAQRRAEDVPTQLARAALDAIVTIDGNDRVIDWNPAAARLFGYTRDEAVGRSMAELIVPPEHREAHLRGVREAARHSAGQRVARRYELNALRKDGTRFDAEISITTLPGDEPRFAGFVRDVTERHRHEETLTRFQRLVDAVQDYAIYSLDPQGRVMSWNTGAALIKGYAEEEVIGRHFRIFYLHEDQARAHPEENLERAAREGRLQEEGWRVRKDGSRFWARVTMTPIRDAGGDLKGFAEVMRDMTLTREAQQVLATRARQHAIVAELGLDALRGAPLQRLFDRAVHELRDLLAVDYTKVLQLDPDGATLTLRAGEGWQPRIRVHHSQVSAGLESQAGHTLAADGPVIVENLPAETRFHGPPLLVDHGVVSGMSVVIHGTRGPWGVLGIHGRARRQFTQDDVNFLQSVANVLANAIQRKESEEILERRVEERTRRLSETNQDLQTFANAASHDLRAPIRGVDHLLGAVIEDHGDELPPEALRLIEAARRDNRRAGRLIQDILSFARSSQADLRPEDVDVTSMAREISREISEQHPERMTTWVVEEGMRLRADPRLLRVALWNVLENASKYSARQADPRVEIEARGEGDTIVLSVRDNGIGFDPSEAPRLFSPFQRLSTAHGVEGTGLGLPTAARIMSRHGGRIAAEGRLGGGATFRLVFPTAPATRVDGRGRDLA